MKSDKLKMSLSNYSNGQTLKLHFKIYKLIILIKTVSQN